jgi:hypothetical protein
MEEKMIGKEESAKVVDLIVKVMLHNLISTTAPTDWAKAGGQEPGDETLPVTLHFPRKFVEKTYSNPGAESALNLFVTLAVAHYVTYKAECIVEDLDEEIKKTLNKVKAPKESPNMKVVDMTKEYMKRIVIN